MTTWYQARRLVAGLVAFGTAYILEDRGMSFWGAGLVGVLAAVVVASLLFPLIWKISNKDNGATREK